MTQQINTESIIIDILNGLQQVITEQERLNVAKMVLYMHLSKIQMFEEETSLSVDRDNTSEWVRSYLVSMAVRGCTRASVEAYRHEYKVFFPWINKDIKLITTNDIRGYLAYCKISRKNKDITINAKIRMLRGLFLWLYEEEYIEKNPMMKIKENKVEHRVKEVFKDEEVTILKDVCMKKHIRDIAIVNFLHSTGVRVSEMVGLDIRDIDIAGRECIVYGKGRKERRVYFNGETAVHLKEYLESRTDENPALFVQLKKPHNRISDDGVRYMLNTTVKLDKRLSGVHNNPHKWRRQFVTDLLEKDVPLQLVADLAGHENMNTTKENYANYSKSKAKEVHKKYVA